jgi:hypothetical protein
MVWVLVDSLDVLHKRIDIAGHDHVEIIELFLSTLRMRITAH